MKKLNIAFILSFCFFIVTLTAQKADIFPPQPIPDRVILTWSGDPATTQSVSWRTDTTITVSLAEIAIADPGPDFVRNASRMEGTFEVLNAWPTSAHYHSITFSDLLPNTLYAYRVGDGIRWSEWFQFKTASAEEAPFSFVYFGDAQNGLKSLWSRCIRQAFMTMPNVDFLLHAGDLINSPNSDMDWGSWFHAGGWIYGMKSNIACPGNHEYEEVNVGKKTEAKLSKYWTKVFNFPKNAPEHLAETYYYIDYQGTRIISLNTMTAYTSHKDFDEQLHWLKKVLRNNPNRWTIITQHHPIYSSKMGRDNPLMRQVLQPLYEEYGVDLVLQGHDHTYGRGHNLNYGGRKFGDLGPTYVVSVSGPKMYDLNFEDWIECAASNTQLYQIIKVNKGQLNYQAYTATGELYDAFEIIKGSNGKNHFIDKSSPDGQRLNMPHNKMAKMSASELTIFQQKIADYKKKLKRRKEIVYTDEK